MLTEFEVMGFPLPNRPIWLYCDGLQPGGWHIAVIEAAPANGGVTVPPPAAGIVVGVVDTYSSESPVRMTPFVSKAVAISGCVLLGFTSTGFVETPAALSAIDAGGQVENIPAELAALAIFAEINTDPG